MRAQSAKQLKKQWALCLENYLSLMVPNGQPAQAHVMITTQEISMATEVSACWKLLHVCYYVYMCYYMLILPSQSYPKIGSLDSHLDSS